MSGAEAARLLGVKRETLYAYASRGLLRSEPGGSGGNSKVYRRSDVERLRARSDARAGHGAVAASALRFGEPVLDSALTDIQDGGLLYRGISAVTLAESDTAFEEVARFLWTGEPITPGGGAAYQLFKVTRASAASIDPKHLAALLPHGTPALPSLSLMAAAMGAQDLERFQAPLSTELPRAGSIVKRLAAALGVGDNPRRVRAALSADTVANAALIALGGRTSRAAARAVNRALVLIADHELNPSTFAVRIAASAGADLYACVSAGLATLSGPEHGGACDRVEALVAETERPERARAVVQDRTRRGEAIPGFGHRLYPSGDPRSRPVLRAAADLAPKSALVRTVLAIEEAMREAGREPATIDTAFVALAAALDAPPGSAAGLIAVGRCAGWIAHALEQRAAGFTVRPRARYVGQ